MASGDRKIIVFLKEHGFFLGLFLLAAILRFWNLGQLDLSHDELSALYRTQFDTFQELINQAVRVDGHPALVQVFLYFWAPWFNYQEFWLKLPSLILGLASLYLVYAASLKLKRKQSGLLAVLIMSLSSFFLYYHQVARPYAYGSFFVALAAYAYINWFFHKPKLKYLLLFGISASLAAYTHYLALLSVFIIGVGALIRSWPKPKAWLLTGIAVLVSFLPHLGIFWDQLQLGGIGAWLSPPDAFWLWDYSRYLTNYSLVAILALLIILAFHLKKNAKPPFPEAWIWFLSCFTVAFLYSLLREPLLRFSSLIFLSPFLFLSPMQLSKWIYRSFLTILLAALALGLWQREYFWEAHRSPPKEAETYLNEIERDLPVYYHWSEEKWQFYREKDPSIPKGIALKSNSKLPLSVDEFILLCDHSSPGHWPLQILDHQFKLIIKAHHFGFSLYHFKRDSQLASVPMANRTILARQAFACGPNQYHQLVELGQDSIPLKSQEDLLVADLENFSGNQAHLVFQVLKGEEQIAWYAFPLKDGRNYCSRPFADLSTKDHRWRILIDQGSMDTQCRGRIRLRYWEANAKVYGLVQDF